jgi:hypothetical protein
MNAEIVPGVTVREYLEITQRMVEGSQKTRVNYPGNLSAP